MDKDARSTVVGRDKAKTLVLVEKLNIAAMIMHIS